MGLQFGGVRRWGAGIEVDWRAHPGSESGDMLSYESQMPAAAGTRRSEKPELWSGNARWPGGFCHARPRPQRGTSPRTTFFFSGHRPWVYNSAGFAGGEPASRLIGGHIPDRSPGTCFRTNRKCRLLRVHEGRKSRSCGLVRRVGPADSATPDPGPSGGQAPALHSSFLAIDHGSTIRRGSPVGSRHRG